MFPGVAASGSPRCVDYLPSRLPAHVSQSMAFVLNQSDWVCRSHSQLADDTSPLPPLAPLEPFSAPCPPHPRTPGGGG